MRILLIHSDYLNYNVKKKTPVAEEIEEAKKEGSFDDSLVVFTAVEKEFVPVSETPQFDPEAYALFVSEYAASKKGEEEDEEEYDE